MHVFKARAGGRSLSATHTVVYELLHGGATSSTYSRHTRGEHAGRILFIVIIIDNVPV